MEKRKEKAGGIAWELVLPVGEENAISAVELCGRLGLSDTRSLRYAVMAARLSGVPICSLAKSERSGGGYFMAYKPDEIEHTVNEMRKRAFSSLKQAAMLTRWKNGEDKFSQMSIEQFLKEEEARAVS